MVLSVQTSEDLPFNGPQEHTLGEILKDTKSGRCYKRCEKKGD